jgi:hypothetical protein
MLRGEDEKSSRLRRKFLADNSFDALEVSAVWDSDVRSPKCLLAMLVTAYNALQSKTVKWENKKMKKNPF